MNFGCEEGIDRNVNIDEFIGIYGCVVDVISAIFAISRCGEITIAISIIFSIFSHA